MMFHKIPTALFCAAVLCTVVTENLEATQQTQVPAATAPTTAVAEPDVEALLALPVSPGAIALLRPHAALTRVQERWRDSVAHESPAVRAAAARMVHVAGVRWIVPSLIKALASETDHGAAIEQVLAILNTGDANGVEFAAGAAARLKGDVAAVFLSTLARVRPADVLARATVLGTAADDIAVGSSLAHAAHAPSADADALAAAAMARGRTAWTVFLREARWLGLTVAPSWGDLARKGGASDLVDELGWALTIRADAGDASVAAVIAEWTTGDQPPPGVTLARRVVGENTAKSVDLLAGLDADQQQDLAWRIDEYRLSKWLNGRERSALERHLGRQFPSTPARPTSNAHVSFGVDAERPRPLVPERIRSFGPFPAGFVADLITVTACEPSNMGMGATVAFRDDGRPSGVAVQTDGVTVACQRVLRALATSSVLPASETDRQARFRFVSDFATPGAMCEGTYVPAVARYAGRPLWRRDGTAIWPVRTHERQPAVPSESRRRGIQGVLIGSLVVGPSGCVSSVEVYRPIPTLDAAAISNVQQWLFTPATAQGRPVPSNLYWIVNFMY